MRVLIMSMTCGNGHNAIAQAIKSSFSDDDVVEIFDIFGINKKESMKNNNAYIGAVKHIPHLYDFFWNLMRKRNPKHRFSWINFLPIKKVANYNKNKIESFNPDAIICTQNYASNICTYLMRNGYKIKAKIYAYLHDYVACPFWETSVLCNNIFTPSEFCTDELLKLGYTTNQVVPVGFPIDKKFNKQLNRNEILSKYNLKSSDFIIVSLAGGFGQSNSLNVVKYFRKIKNNATLIVICGKNQSQKSAIDKYIKKYNLNNVLCFGFVNNIDELLTISTLAITRGGPNSVNEIFSKGVIPIFREGLIINEALNRDLFVKSKTGVGLKKIKQLPLIIDDFIENPQKIATYRENINKFYTPNASDKIVEYIKNNQNSN